MASGAVLTKSGYNNILQLTFSSSDTRSYSVFAIGTGTTTPAITNTTLENTITGWAGGTADYKAYSTVSFDSASQSVTARGFITAAEATGKVITEYADMNTLATKGLAGHFVFIDGPTKTAAVQVSIITVYTRTG